MTIVLPHGVLFRGGEEGTIRRNLVENHHIQAIIGLPANIFFGTGIPTIVMVLRKHRDDDHVLIVDASKYFTKEGKNNKLRASDIKRIVDAVTGNRDVDKFSRLVGIDEIRQNDYNLNIPRYVDSSDNARAGMCIPLCSAAFLSGTSMHSANIGTCSPDYAGAFSRRRTAIRPSSPCKTFVRR
mgnify:CR=1 FL=1